jgi:hypothetical protein
MSASRHIGLLLSFAIIMAWSLPSSNGQDKDKGKGSEISAEKLAEEYAADFGKFDKFAEKYRNKTIRVRGKIKVIDGAAFFIPGKKLANGDPVKIGLAINPASLKEFPEGSLVVAETSNVSLSERQLMLQKCRLFPGTKKKNPQ